jgi:hypothetical protein
VELIMYRFSSKPVWAFSEPKKGEPVQTYEALEAPTATAEIVARALTRIEYRTQALLLALEPVTAETVFFRPPNDLPALLRTADQLLTFARQEAGERASVWGCECGTRYAVPVSLMRPVSIRCERCGRTLDLDPRAAGDSHIAEPFMAEVNEYRRALSGFFREAMARGWPVVVAKAAT